MNEPAGTYTDIDTCQCRDDAVLKAPSHGIGLDNKECSVGASCGHFNAAGWPLYGNGALFLAEWVNSMELSIKLHFRAEAIAVDI